ncbi:hypothetical protein DFS34DRAFT_589597 [Phlyctochytrium arcticum]|nr:hypothetical protein DFS34DRAFT_589597 [Phlyctochytrium arcticum]
MGRSKPTASGKKKAVAAEADSQNTDPEVLSDAESAVDLGSEDYEVEEILDYRNYRVGYYSLKHCQTVQQYLIKWKGYTDADNTWEPVGNIHSQELIDAFWSKNKQTPKQPGNVGRAAFKKARGMPASTGSASTGSKPKATPNRKAAIMEEESDEELTPSKRKGTTKVLNSDNKKRRKVDKEEVTSPPPPVEESEEEEAEDDDAMYDTDSILSPEVRDADSWDNLIKKVDTVEQGQLPRELVVFVQWKNGTRSMHSSHVTNKRCPQAIWIGKLKPSKNLDDSILRIPYQV